MIFQSLDGQGDGVSVDLNSVTEATLNQDGQIILTGEDGQGKKFNQRDMCWNLADESSKSFSTTPSLTSYIFQMV